MSAALVYGAFLAGEFVYHRLTDHRKPPEVATEIQIPLVEEGSPIPVFFGRVRIRQPILAACGEFASYPTGSDAQSFGWNFNVDGLDTDAYPIVYGLDMLFVLGIPFADGVNRMHAMWAGDTEMLAGALLGKTIEDATGGGNHEQPSTFTSPNFASFAEGEGLVEFLNGNSSQQLVSSPGTTSLTFAADRLTTLGQGTVDPAKLSGLRGYASAFLFSGRPLDDDLGAATADEIGDVYEAGPGDARQYLRWIVGVTATPPAYSFEASSYPSTSLDQRMIGDEANPADVAYAIWKDKLGKLGLPATRVDYESFRACAETLRIERHGYSRVFEGLISAEDALKEIEAQTDCAFDEDPYDGLIKMKLIRADFNPPLIPVITVDNCERLENFAAGGWSDIPNKVRVVYEDRENGYQPDSITADNQANVVGQDGETREVVLQMPGIKTRLLAKQVAGRELAARSRPIAKFRAIVDRSFWRAMVGDAIAVNMPEYNISGRIFRVARPVRGTADSNTMALDLVEDYFYVHRFQVSGTVGLPTHPGEAVG